MIKVMLMVMVIMYVFIHSFITGANRERGMRIAPAPGNEAIAAPIAVSSCSTCNHNITRMVMMMMMMMMMMMIFIHSFIYYYYDYRTLVDFLSRGSTVFAFFITGSGITPPCLSIVACCCGGGDLLL